MKPRAVVFDLGKVLVDFDYGITVRAIQSRCVLPPDELNSLINQSPLLYRYETGELTTPEFFDEVRRASGYSGDLQDFRGSFGDIFSAISPMIELQATLRSRGIPTFIFSNTNDLAVAHIRERFPFFAGFDGYILSYEHGAMKPDQHLYEVVERCSGLKGSSILYLDDRPENIATGRDRGWRTILHHDPAESITQVNAHGLL
jgi:FMN phosphatase YigB (HAD superfamily)